jgi:hypothetical protein
MQRFPPDGWDIHMYPMLGADQHQIRRRTCVRTRSAIVAGSISWPQDDELSPLTHMRTRQ